MTAKVLAEEMQAMVFDRPVLDKTGLTGKFDFNLAWRPESGAASSGDTNNSDIFTAIQEQLGLRLEPRREEAEVIVVDAAEKPTAN